MYEIQRLTREHLSLQMAYVDRLRSYVDQPNAQTWVVVTGNRIIGFVTLLERSRHPNFQDKNIPEIMDLWVDEDFRGKGVATKLMDVAEESAFSKSNAVGIGVGLYSDYGNAQQMYVRRGYVPDRTGLSYKFAAVQPGSSVRVDDDLLLWLVKQR